MNTLDENNREENPQVFILLYRVGKEVLEITNFIKNQLKMFYLEWKPKV